jgi:hypothetical protein
MKNPGEIINPETIGWLLEEENPSVRYFTLRDILGKQDDDPEVFGSKQAIQNSGIVPRILQQQQKEGYWVSPGRFYTAKYTGTVWQLMILAELGADGSDVRIKDACEFILSHSQEPESGGFAHKERMKGGGGLKSEVIPCLTGNLIWSLIKHGFLADERIRKGIEWICKYQRADDGDSKPPAAWPYERYEMCWGRHTCHMGIVKTLKALSAIPETKRTTVVNQKIAFLAEYLLKHHIYKKSHDLAKTSKPGWLKPGFPLMYQTDILEILEILTHLGYHDLRMKDAVEKLRGKMNLNGRWILENSFNGKMTEDIEVKGNASKWITMKALKIIKQYYNDKVLIPEERSA